MQAALIAARHRYSTYPLARKNKLGRKNKESYLQVSYRSVPTKYPVFVFVLFIALLLNRYNCHSLPIPPSTSKV